MNVRWKAVLTGFLAVFLVSQLLFLFATAEFFTSPDLTRPGDVLLISLLVLSTGVGGYIAGRMAHADRWLNGLLVAIVGILLGQLGPPQPRVFVVATVIACFFAALGGYLSRFPAERKQRSSDRG